MSHILSSKGQKTRWLLGQRALMSDATTMRVCLLCDFRDISHTYIVLIDGGKRYVVLCICPYYLAKDHEIQQVLRQEVKDAMSPDGPPHWSKLTQLPLLYGILQETSRMHPPVPQGMAKITPKQGTQTGEDFVSSNVIASAPTWSIQHDKRKPHSASARSMVPANIVQSWRPRSSLQRSLRRLTFSLRLGKMKWIFWPRTRVSSTKWFQIHECSWYRERSNRP